MHDSSHSDIDASTIYGQGYEQSTVYSSVMSQSHDTSTDLWLEMRLVMFSSVRYAHVQ